MPPPYFKDKFFKIHQMVQAWNDHMKDLFILSWVSCLDSSIYMWTDKFACPRWMFVPISRVNCVLMEVVHLSTLPTLDFQKTPLGTK